MWRLCYALTGICILWGVGEGGMKRDKMWKEEDEREGERKMDKINANGAKYDWWVLVTGKHLHCAWREKILSWGGGWGSIGFLDKNGTLRIIIRYSTYRYRVSFKVMCNDVHQMQLTAEPGGHYRCKTESCSRTGSFFWIDRQNSVRYTRIMLAFLCAQSMLGWRQWRDCLTRFTWATRGWVK